MTRTVDGSIDAYKKYDIHLPLEVAKRYVVCLVFL